MAKTKTTVGCSVESCTRDSKSKGLCSAHYQASRRNGPAPYVLDIKPGTPALNIVQGIPQHVPGELELLADLIGQTPEEFTAQALSERMERIKQEIRGSYAPAVTEAEVAA